MDGEAYHSSPEHYRTENISLDGFKRRGTRWSLRGTNDPDVRSTAKEGHEGDPYNLAWVLV